MKNVFEIPVGSRQANTKEVKKKIRVVICVEGGNVVSIYASPEKAKELDIEVIDYDNLEAGGMTSKEASDYGLKATDGLKDVL